MAVTRTLIRLCDGDFKLYCGLEPGVTVDIYLPGVEEADAGPGGLWGFGSEEEGGREGAADAPEARGAKEEEQIGQIRKEILEALGL